MKREIPILIVGIAGVIMVLQYFVPTDWSTRLFEKANDWVIVIGILALPLGIWSLIRANVEKLKVPGERFYSGVLLAGFLAMIITGLWHWDASLEAGTAFSKIFDHVTLPLWGFEPSIRVLTGIRPERAPKGS